MKRIEILTEELSMKHALEIILPKIVPNTWVLNENYFIRPHSGKSDLKKSIPKKIKAFNHDNVGIVIVHDQDSAECKELKQKLRDLCQENIKNPLLIRIACKELESWYLGDFNALKIAYPECERNKIFFQRNRNPDILQASDEIRKIIPTFQNIQGAKNIAPHMEVIKTEQNNSHSFRIFIKGITNFFIQNTTI